MAKIWTNRRLKRKIPGVTGKRVPGNPGMPRMVGAHVTRVPRQADSSTFREFNRTQIKDTRGRFMGGWGFAWQGLADVATNVFDFAVETEEALAEAMEGLKDEMVAYAQENAIWIDHPGEHEDARKNIQGVVVKEGDGTYSIYLGHGKNVYYGIWLEVRWGGKYAIILPTIYKFAPTIGERVKIQT